MSADGPRAHDILLGYEPLEHHGACLYYVWQAYKATGAATSLGSQTAYQGWRLSSGKHYDMNPPEGAAIWLGKRYDGNMDGDVFIAGTSDGHHAATDQPVYGQTGETTIRARMNLCGREYLGWTDHIYDCPITLGGEEDDVKITPIYIEMKPDQKFGKGMDTTNPHRYLVKAEDGNTRICTGPNDQVVGVLSITITGLAPGQACEIRTSVATEQDDGTWHDNAIGKYEVTGNSGGVVTMIPVSVRLTSSKKILRYIVYGKDADIVVTEATWRGAEYTS